jgi:hypothetical protein
VRNSAVLIFGTCLLLGAPACAALVDESGHPCPCDDAGFVCCAVSKQCVPRDQASACLSEASADQAANGSTPDATDSASNDGMSADASAKTLDAPPESSPLESSVLEAGDATVVADARADAPQDAAPQDAGPQDAALVDADGSTHVPTWAVCTETDAAYGSNVATTAYGYGATRSAIASSTGRIVWTGFDIGTIDIETFDIGPEAGPPTMTSIEPAPDGGWRLPARLISAIAINPWNDREVLVAMTGQSNGAPNLFRSADGGQSWTQLATIAQAGIAEVWSISFNPLNPSFVYAVGAPDGAVAQSGDDGATWGTTRATGDPIVVGGAGTLVTSATLEREDPNAVVVGTSDGHVWATANGAQGPWTWINDPSTAPDGSQPMPRRPITRIVANPRLNPPALFVTYVGQAPDSVWMSLTGGYLWQAIATGLPNGQSDPAYAYFGVSLQWLTLFPGASGAGQYLSLNGTCGTAFSPDLGAHWTFHAAAMP